MEDMNKYSFEMTKYPKIYKKTYWGNFKSDENERDIIDNRNKFIEDYGILSICESKTIDRFIHKGKNSGYRMFFDHCEGYKTNDKKYVLIMSPYHGSIKHFISIVDLSKFKEEFGFREINKLYHENATTMIKVIDNLKELRKETNYL